jgi:phosphoesterase RecJ-like protein
MDKDFGRLTDLIMKHDRFALATHINPDGDAIGSTLALGMYLESISKSVFMTSGAEQVFPDQYRFLPASDSMVDTSSIPSDIDVFIAIDCSTKDRLGETEGAFDSIDKTVNIDHHRGNTQFASLNLVDEKRASCSEIVYELIKRLSVITGEPIDNNMAVCLYTGIVADTGRFQYSSTRPDTMRSAAELLENGVDPGFVFRNMFENQSLARIKLFGVAYLKTHMDQETGVISSFIKAEDFLNTGTRPSDAEDLVDILRSVSDVKVAVLVKEIDNGLKVSLRSTGSVDVGHLAETFGGGGHAMAAGFSTDMDEDTLMTQIKTIVKSATGADE